LYEVIKLCRHQPGKESMPMSQGTGLVIKRMGS
jgi:hypothetical protein